MPAMTGDGLLSIHFISMHAKAQKRGPMYKSEPKHNQLLKIQK